MLDLLKISFCNINIFYPSVLGIGYLKYKKKRIQNNFNSFDSSSEVIRIVNEAIEKVPYYNKIYHKPIRNFPEFLEKISFIDKDIVMNNWEDFHNNDLNNSKVIFGTTGGTSGKQLKLILPKKRYIFELATMHTIWANVGWRGQTRGVLRNHHLEDSQTFKTNFIKNEIIFDGFRNDKIYYYEIYNLMKEHSIHYIHAYPSSAYQFSLFLKNENLDASFIKAFLCGSEGVMPEQKFLIENQLGIKMYSWYGHSEKLVLGGHCSKSDNFHIEPTYGYFELIDNNGDAISEPGKVGEIVGTTLHNPYMPLIRYRTGDFAEYVGDFCPHCKRYLPLIKNIQGRWDYNKIYFKDMSYTTITALNLHNSLYTHIEGLQYVQKDYGKLVIYIKKTPSYDNFIENQFKQHFDKSFGNNCDYIIEYVEQLYKESNGKFLLLKQLINFN
jgi:phenylacetate-CoA ligase